MLEREIERVLVSEAKGLGGRAYKWVSPGNDGVPDRIVILPNQTPAFVELKSETGRPTRLQKIQINRLVELGQQVYVVKGIIGVSRFFRKMGYPDIAEKLDKKYGLEAEQKGWRTEDEI